jgi:hypothetical protein
VFMRTWGGKKRVFARDHIARLGKRGPMFPRIHDPRDFFFRIEKYKSLALSSYLPTYLPSGTIPPGLSESASAVLLTCARPRRGGEACRGSGARLLPCGFSSLPAGSIGIQRRKKKNLKKKRKKKFLKIKKSTGFWAYKAAVHVVIFAV